MFAFIMKSKGIEIDKKASWYVDINKVRTDYPVIDNLQQFLRKEVPLYHPDHPEYTKFWSKETKICIEGMWGSMFGKYRYMPGNLYYFGNYGVLEHTWKDERGIKVTDHIKPLIVDYLWEFAYQSWACHGFSGFEKDDNISCNIFLKRYYDGLIEASLLPKTCFKANGDLKQYEDAYAYLHRLHEKPMGKSLFENPCENAMTFGCLVGGTNVRMYDGSTKDVKDIIVGDRLMGPDFLSREVKDTFVGRDYLYTITDGFGKSFTCTGTHQLNCLRNDINGAQTTVNKSVETILDDIALNGATYESINVYLKNIKNPLHISASIGRGTYYGFEVDKDHLYLLEDGTVTHNSRGGTKALLHGSKVQTPLGPVNIEDIKIGDYVFGQDGKPTKVIKVSPQGTKQIYEIIFNSGRKIKCCADHLWQVNDKNNRKRVLRTEDLKEKLTKYNPFYIPLCEPVEYAVKRYKVDPYILGYHLGDGDSCTGRFASLDEEPIEEYKKQYKVTQSSHDNLHYHATGLIKDLKYLGVSGNKHIPQEYLQGSIVQRKDLLAGLLDSDGGVTMNRGSCRIVFTNKNKNIADGVVILCNSLGIKCKLKTQGNFTYDNNTKKRKRIGVIYRVELYTRELLFKIKRKNDIIKISNHRINFKQDSIRSIKETGIGEATCISVDNKDKLFLADDFVVTHNSFWSAIGEVEYNFVFRCARRYDEEFVRGGYTSHQVSGSYESSKSGEMLSKFAKSQDFKINTEEKYRKWFGTWVETEYDDKGRPTEVITPCPFYQRTLGTLNCPNTEKTRLFRARYKIEINGEWKEKGSGCSIGHVNYSAKKGNGERAAEGARAQYCNYEEFGSMENGVEVLGANEGVVTRGGSVIGVQHAQGTSGNIEYVQAAKKVFLNPRDYRIRGYTNKFSSQGKNNEIGYFIPFYITLLDHKDINGNTNYQNALAEVNRQRSEYAASDDPRVLRSFLMNKPCYVPEMWLTDKGYYLPYEEAAEQERRLANLQLYKELALPVELYWDESRKYKVHYKPVYDREFISDWPMPKDLKNPSGCVVIYEQPEYINGEIPNDLYCFVGHDPYVQEDIDKGGSLGVTYVLKNPKYIPQGHTGNIIVASYIGKPEKGLEYYYEQQHKLLCFYGMPQQGLWYEKNRGEDCRAYYIRKNAAHLLAPTPQYEQGNSSKQKHLTSWGYTVGSQGSIQKKILIRKMRDWLTEETEMMENGQMTKKLNIFRIPCIFLVRQIMDFNMEQGSNFDAVMGFLGCIVGLKEYGSMLEATSYNDTKSSPLKSLLSNPKIFKQYNTILN